MLEVHELTKLFNSIPAVQEVSFTVRPYEVLGYLGPNGSGKTTTAKMLTGLLQPSRGHILFEGKSIQSNLIEFKRRLGYVPEEPYLYPYLTGREYLQLVGRLQILAAREIRIEVWFLGNVAQPSLELDEIRLDALAFE